MQDLVHRRPFMQHHARLFLHGHHFKRPHGVEVAQPSMRYRTNAAGPSRQKAPHRSLHQCRWIHAQLPALLSRLSLQRGQSQARLTYRNAFTGNLHQPVHPRQVKHDPAFKRNALTVVPRSCPSYRHGNVSLSGEAQYIPNLIDIDRLHHDIRPLVFQLPLQHRRIPVKILRKPFHDGRVDNNAGRVSYDLGQSRLKCLLHVPSPRDPNYFLRVDHCRNAFNMFG